MNYENHSSVTLFSVAYCKAVFPALSFIFIFNVGIWIKSWTISKLFFLVAIIKGVLLIESVTFKSSFGFAQRALTISKLSENTSLRISVVSCEFDKFW